MMDPAATTTPTDPAPPGRGARRDQIRHDKEQAEADTRREIDLIVAEFHARLPRADAQSIGLIYARYSTRFQASIADQVRVCLETALHHRIYVPIDHICFDQATPGSKADRPGLNQVHQLIDAGSITSFLAFTTNRLHRKMHRCLRFVEEELVERGIRVLFPKSNIDTADTRSWKLLLSIHSLMDELVVSMYAGNVQAAQVGLMERGLVFGSLCLGYAGEPIPGEYTKQKRPRCRIIVDPESSKIVLQVFRWYADDRLSIDGIVRRLNDDRSIPLPSLSQTGVWSRELVRRMLANPRYRGLWQYGVTQSEWQSRKDYSRKLLRDQPLRTMQVEPLRIVTDETWARVQQRLQSDPKQVGRKPKDGNKSTRPRLLNGLFRCPVHDRPLYVTGPQGQMMYCKSCQETTADTRPLFSLLNRAGALRQTCQALANLVRTDESLVGSIICACQDEVRRAGQPDPTRADQLRKKIQQADRQIKFLLEDAGESDDDRRESAAALRQLRRSRSTDAAELAALEAAIGRPVAVPDEAEVRTIIDRLATILEGAAAAESEGEQGVAREIITLLTGGRIDLEQQGERMKHLGWLRGRVRVRLLSYLTCHAAGADVAPHDEGHEILIDYREPTRSEALADRAKALFDRGILVKEIARQLGETRAIVAKALEHWHLSRGLPVPDGRSRRATLEHKHLDPPIYRKLAGPAKELYDQGLLNSVIAERLDCDRNTVTKAIVYWFESRGLAVPDGRTRRKGLAVKTVRPSPRS